jgi:hypothetical protein
MDIPRLIAGDFWPTYCFRKNAGINALIMPAAEADPRNAMTGDKLVLQTPEEPKKRVQEPHFDEEATLTAKRVVPLSAAPSVELRGARSGRWPVLTLVAIVITAGTVGLIGGMSIAGYRFIKQNSPEANRPEQVNGNGQDVAAQSETEVPAPSPQAEVRNVPPKATQAVVVTREAERAEPAPKSETSPTPPQIETPKQNESQSRRSIPSPATHKRDEVKDRSDGTQGAADQSSEWTQMRRERRRHAREASNPESDPRAAQRGERRIDRIRDIFMGPPQT